MFYSVTCSNLFITNSTLTSLIRIHRLLSEIGIYPLHSSQFSAFRDEAHRFDFASIVSIACKEPTLNGGLLRTRLVGIVGWLSLVVVVTSFNQCSTRVFLKTSSFLKFVVTFNMIRSNFTF